MNFRDMVKYMSGACCAAVLVCGVNVNGIDELVPLQKEDIRTLISTTNPMRELSIRLFPSPFEEIDVIGITGKDFACRLDMIGETKQVNVLFSLFQYCHELRTDSHLPSEIASIKNYTESMEENIKKLRRTAKKVKTNAALYLENQAEIDRCIHFSAAVKKHEVFGFDWMFAMLARSMHSEPYHCFTERLLWTFCCQYLEIEDVVKLSNAIKESIGLLPKVDCAYIFPYKIGTPMIAHDAVTIDGVEFPDCIETAVRHFFNIIQPTDPSLLCQYWNSMGSPVGDEMIDFFAKIQKNRKANDGSHLLRTSWAKIISKVPELTYKRKTQDSLLSNNVELKAGWSNYLKAIAYIKNNHFVWSALRHFDANFPKVVENPFEIICDSFAQLAGNTLISIQWCSGDKDEGLRDMENGWFDLLGRIRCNFLDVPRAIDFVMQNGHGFVEWAKD